MSGRRYIKCYLCEGNAKFVREVDKDMLLYKCTKCGRYIYRIKVQTASGKDKWIKCQVIKLPLRIYFKDGDNIVYAEFLPEDIENMHPLVKSIMGIIYDENRKWIYCKEWSVSKESYQAVLYVDGKPVAVKPLIKVTKQSSKVCYTLSDKPRSTT